MTIPTPKEVTEYAKSISFSLDGEAFCDYYEMRGWKLKGNIPLKSWKAAVRTWKRNGYEQQSSNTLSASDLI